MGNFCGSDDKEFDEFKRFYNRFQEFILTENDVSTKIDLKNKAYLEGFFNKNRDKIIDKMRLFISKKQELLTMSKEIHDNFFDKSQKILPTDDPDNLCLEIERLDLENENYFYFFFNKRRKFKKIILKSSKISFPRFYFEIFPEDKKNDSHLQSIIINYTKINFDMISLEVYSNLKMVSFLNLNFNEIKSLPVKLNALKNLKELHVKRNLLKSFPPEFTSLENLEIIDASENQFVHLPSIILKIKKIIKANFIANVIRDFDLYDDETTSHNFNVNEKLELEYLYLNKNLIETLPEDYIKNKNFSKLKHLSLDENPIKFINKDIQKLIENNYKNIITYDSSVQVLKQNEFEEEEEEKTATNELVKQQSNDEKKAEDGKNSPQEEKKQDPITKDLLKLTFIEESLGKNLNFIEKEIYDNFTIYIDYAHKDCISITNEEHKKSLYENYQNAFFLAKIKKFCEENREQDLHKVTAPYLKICLKKGLYEYYRMKTMIADKKQDDIDYIKIKDWIKLNESMQDEINKIKNNKNQNTDELDIVDKIAPEVIQVIERSNTKERKDFAKIINKIELPNKIMNILKSNLIAKGPTDSYKVGDEKQNLIENLKNDNLTAYNMIISLGKIIKKELIVIDSKKETGKLQNIEFLAEIKNKLTSSKIKHTLNLLKNIDKKIEGFFSKIITDEPVTNLNFILTEFRIFFDNITKSFEANTDTLKDENSCIKFDYTINKDNNIYKKILLQTKINETLKILYRLGLDDHEEDEINSKYIFTFNLHYSNFRKMKFMISFVDIMLKNLKN